MAAVLLDRAVHQGRSSRRTRSKSLMPENIVTMTQLGGQSISASINMTQAIILEAIATFFLVFVVFGTAVDPKGPKVGGFAIGLTVTADILGIGPLTGASMNPARSFGPAVVTHLFEGQAAYWIGPLIGAISAALLYRAGICSCPAAPN